MYALIVSLTGSRFSIDRKLAKSTLVLIPMFGVHAIIFIGMPDGVTSGTWWTIRMYFDLFFNSFQVNINCLVYLLIKVSTCSHDICSYDSFSASLELSTTADCLKMNN